MTIRTWLLAILGVVAAAAAVLSFSSLRDLARQCGFDSRLAWLLPVVVDAGAAGGSIVWLGVWAGDVARRFARALALSLLALSVVANALGHALEAYGLQPPWWVVVAVSGIAPAVLGAVVHLAVLLGRIPVVVDEVSVVPELDDDGPTSWWDTAPPAPPTSSDRASELIAEGIGRRRLAKELGVTEHEARQLLAASRHTGAGEGA
ncbi:DUF2637 domain-containing protein [Pseudonocardia parietis]|uniref:DUF2637 domain-containing protein n=1 Tax=Pseudonocardia parietis TaxID=570936 RepID=A0ABS4W130_9PSEU|nr:DUF2637 domain-containing protein [Pseudonocardia parietis]MBP2369913.1 hypothetical protein [Pseudonocardia parietis]